MPSVTDALKKVHASDPLRIPAATFNTLIDVARDHQASRQNSARRPEMPLQPPGVTVQAMVAELAEKALADLVIGDRIV